MKRPPGSDARAQALDAILEALRFGATRRAAAAAAGIASSTLYRWLDEEPDVRDALEKAEGEAQAMLLGRIRRAADNGTWQAAAWILERRWPADFGRRVELGAEEGAGRIEVRLSFDPSAPEEQAA